jgi:HD-GYP domain-containing protein (c-di-GMP phosphodiesterase class II)
MRYIDISLLRPGMIVGKNLYNENNQMLLGKDTVIRPEYIPKIKELGYSGLYIMDEESKDIEIKEIISMDLRIDAVKKLKKAFISEVDKDIKKIDEQATSIKEIVEEVVDNIIYNKDLMINMIDLKTYNDYTYYHSVNVAVIAIAIGVALELNKRKLYHLGMAAMLHDIGKKFISLDILDKKGPLTNSEFLEIKRHPELGYEHIKKHYDLPASVYIAIRQHHEKFDGSGYPDKKSGKDISLFGRILLVADIYDALVSNRPYHDAYSPSDAVEYIMSSNGTMFDPVVVEAFLKKVAAYPIGSSVELSNGIKALVVENFQDANLRPLVKYTNRNGEQCYINLREDISARNITIIGMQGVAVLA